MFAYFQKIKNKINKFDKIAQNPFLQDGNSYNPCVNCINQTYVWIEGHNAINIFNKRNVSNPFENNK